MKELATSSDWLAARAAASPSSQALIEEGGEWTYAQLDRLVGSTCQMLAASGVQVGDHVAVLLPNCLAYVSLIHALGRLGAVLVPLNTRLNSAELARLLSDAGCSHFVTSAAFEQSLIDLSADLPKLILISERLDGLLVTDQPSKEVLPTLVRGQLQAIVFTSGTTGNPKGAMLTLENHFYNAIGSAFRLGVLPDDRWLACLPLYHVGGLAIVLRACLYGTAVVLISETTSESILAAIREHRVSIVSLVPTMLHRLLGSADHELLTSLRFVLLGGAAASADLMARAVSAGVPVATTYGLTEAASQVATMSPHDAALKPGSVGRPLLFTSIRIINDMGETAEIGTVGEICVRGPGIFAGYFNNEAATAEVLRDGELFTGDMGYLDDDGDLWVVQRRSDLIVTGGENVYPAEVETVLALHPAVNEVCVVGLPDAEWGQRVGALITLQQPASEEDLTAFARSHLAGYKVPRVIGFQASLPMTGSGKVSRWAVVAALQASLEVSP